MTSRRRLKEAHAGCPSSLEHLDVALGNSAVQRLSRPRGKLEFHYRLSKIESG
jgi:hypothetical protein